MKQIFQGLRTVAVLILALAYVGCEDDDVVLPQIEAGFTQTINQDTGTVTFINTSANADSYEWDFGDGTTSTEINPIKSFENGTYTVVLNASNSAGATSSFEDMITISIPEAVTFPITFDNPQVSYEANAFNGASFSVVQNPDPSGSNPDSSNVGEITNIGAAFEGFSFELGTPIDLSTNKTVQMDFWSTSAISVLMKLEGGTSADIEVTANHGGTGWEKMYITFNSDSSYSVFTLFVDGPGSTSGTFYIDNVVQINTADIPCTDTELVIPMDFDCESIDYATKIVGNVSFTVVDNPEQSGINSEATKVGQITNVGANFENAFFNLDVPIDFATDKGVKVKIFSTQALPMLLKFEDGTEAPTEDTQSHTGSGWEELTFTLNSSGSYNDMVLFVDGPGTAAGTFYVDDFEQVAGDVGTPCTPETAENIDPANGDLNWTFLTNNDDTTFDAFGNTAGEIVDNPIIDAVNPSCKVQQFIKSSNCQTFAGLGTELATALDFTNAATNKVFTMKVLAENQVTDVTLRLERLPFPDTDPAVDRVANITQVGEWQELTFDFSDVNTGTYKSMIIYFERNQPCDGDIYYFDDIKQVAGTGGGGGGGGGATAGIAQNGDFETGDFTGWEVFENGGSITIDNVENNGGSFSGKIVATGSSAAGSNATLKQERKGAGSVSAGDTVEIKFDYLGGATAPGSVINIQIFGEVDAGGVSFVENAPAPTFSDSWASYTYTFTVPSGADVSGGITLQFNSPCGAVDGCTSTLNLDNVEINVN
ncbi:PKD domain-containing protein [Flavobacteriaceae bacterium M23B6Z8]